MGFTYHFSGVVDTGLFGSSRARDYNLSEIDVDFGRMHHTFNVLDLAFVNSSSSTWLGLLGQA